MYLHCNLPIILVVRKLVVITENAARQCGLLLGTYGSLQGDDLLVESAVGIDVIFSLNGTSSVTSNWIRKDD